MNTDNNSPGEIAAQRLNSQIISELTNGLFSSLVDAALFWVLLLPAASISKKGGIYSSFSIIEEASQLQEKVNYKQFKNAVRKLREKGLIQRYKERKSLQTATKKGIEKLRNTLPIYDEKRLWDGNLYLIQYDISREQNNTRFHLRENVLKKLGAIRLQDSNYLLFDNPKKIIDEFIKKWDVFDGSILISKLTRDAFLTRESLKDYIWRKAKLSEVNRRYEAYLKEYNSKTSTHGIEVCMEFLTIVRDDPQIPYELLLKEYKGDKAYLVYLRNIKNTPFYNYVVSK